MKYLVVGLGNIGSEYAHTRHNIGFDILDALSGASNISFKDKRYGFVAEYKYKARTYWLLKPSTYVNLSGNAVRYWLNKLKLTTEQLLVVVDDIALPYGTLRLRAKGGDAGHNGLAHINTILGSSNYARLRFGVGNDFNPSIKHSTMPTIFFGLRSVTLGERENGTSSCQLLSFRRS